MRRLLQTFECLCPFYGAGAERVKNRFLPELFRTVSNITDVKLPAKLNMLEVITVTMRQYEKFPLKFTTKKQCLNAI